jgi:phosphoenolpyruvate carboxykinase (GTP)
MCLGLGLGSRLARKEGCLSEELLLVGVTDQFDQTTYLAGVPNSVRSVQRTKMALLFPPKELQELRGKVATVGCGVAWMRPNAAGQLCGINAESGFFAVAPGTSCDSNPHVMAACSKNTIFTNVALTDDGDVWWEGLSRKPPAHLRDWKGESWTCDCGRPAAHANSFFTAPAVSCLSFDPKSEDHTGVPIGGFFFEGQSGVRLPLVYEGQNGPCGSPSARGRLARYLGLCLGNAALAVAPRVFHMSILPKGWWRGNEEDARVLQWMIGRVNETASAVEGPLGLVPTYDDFDWSGSELTPAQFDRIMFVDAQRVRCQVDENRRCQRESAALLIEKRKSRAQGGS